MIPPIIPRKYLYGLQLEDVGLCVAGNNRYYLLKTSDPLDIWLYNAAVRTTILYEEVHPRDEICQTTVLSEEPSINKTDDVIPITSLTLILWGRMTRAIYVKEERTYLEDLIFKTELDRRCKEPPYSSRDYYTYDLITNIDAYWRPQKAIDILSSSGTLISED
jgi:hypothetical protein